MYCSSYFSGYDALIKELKYIKKRHSYKYMYNILTVTEVSTFPTSSTVHISFEVQRQNRYQYLIEWANYFKIKRFAEYDTFQ